MRKKSIYSYAAIIIGLAFIIGAIYSGISTYRFTKSAIHTKGEVVDLLVSQSDSGGDLFTPKIIFNDQQGQQHVFDHSVASSPPAYSVNETVDVVYAANHPENAKLDSAGSLWAMPLIMSLFGLVFLGLGGGGMAYNSHIQSKNKALRANGVKVNTKLIDVIRNTAVKFNDQHPFVIVSQWQNPKDGKIIMFKSKNLWFDPSPFLNNQDINVFIAQENPKKYVMDTDFLPEM